MSENNHAIPTNLYTRDQIADRAIRSAVFSSKSVPRQKIYADYDIDLLLNFAKAHIDVFICYASIGYDMSGSDCDQLLDRVKEQLDR